MNWREKIEKMIRLTSFGQYFFLKKKKKKRRGGKEEEKRKKKKRRGEKKKKNSSLTRDNGSRITEFFDLGKPGATVTFPAFDTMRLQVAEIKVVRDVRGDAAFGGRAKVMDGFVGGSGSLAKVFRRPIAQQASVSFMPRGFEGVHFFGARRPAEGLGHHALLAHFLKQAAPVVEAVDRVAGLGVAEDRQVADEGVGDQREVGLAAPSFQAEDAAGGHGPRAGGVHVAQLGHQVGRGVGVAEDGHVAGLEGKALQEVFGRPRQARLEVFSLLLHRRNERRLVAGVDGEVLVQVAGRRAPAAGLPHGALHFDGQLQPLGQRQRRLQRPQKRRRQNVLQVVPPLCLLLHQIFCHIRCLLVPNHRKRCVVAALFGRPLLPRWICTRFSVPMPHHKTHLNPFIISMY